MTAQIPDQIDYEGQEYSLVGVTGNGLVTPETDAHKAVYRNIGLPVAFTGTLRIANDFISALYIHMGFQAPSSYRRVLDLKLVGGRQAAVKDLLQEMERKRGKFKRRYHSTDW